MGVYSDCLFTPIQSFTQNFDVSERFQTLILSEKKWKDVNCMMVYIHKMKNDLEGRL